MQNVPDNNHNGPKRRVVEGGAMEFEIVFLVNDRLCDWLDRKLLEDHNERNNLIVVRIKNDFGAANMDRKSSTMKVENEVNAHTY